MYYVYFTCSIDKAIHVCKQSCWQFTNNFHILALKSLGFEFVTRNAFIASVLEEPKPFVMFLRLQNAHHTFIFTNSNISILKFETAIVLQEVSLLEHR
jgi:hypothetical protein